MTNFQMPPNCRRAGSLWLCLLFSSLSSCVLYSQGIQLTTEFQQARQLLAQGDFDGAVGALQPILQQPALIAAAQIELANIRQRQAESELSKAMNHFSEAASYFSEGTQKGGLSEAEIPKVLYDLGRIYEERLNDFAKAAEAYSRVVQEHPNFLSIDKALYHLATCYEKIGKETEAAECFRELVAKYPYSSFFQIAQNRMKKMPPGTDAAKSAIEIQEKLVDNARGDSQSAKASLDLAAMYAKNGNSKGAIEEYRKVAAEAPTTELAVEAYRKMIALLDEKEKDYQGAADALEEMMSRYPDAPGIDKSLLRLGKIYEKDLEQLHTRVVDGKIQYKKDVGNTMKAIEYYDKLTEKFPDADVSADAYLRKGDLYKETLKDPDEAKKQFEEFLRRFPDHPQADSVREKLKQLENE